MSLKNNSNGINMSLNRQKNKNKQIIDIMKKYKINNIGGLCILIY